MKLFIPLFSLIFLMSAQSRDKSSGCGMGWKVTKSMTTSASSTRNTTNGTFSNTLGMTSGTSGCDYHSIVLKDKNKIHFIESNLQPLQYEVAVGSGERLDAAVSVFGCSSNAIIPFKTLMKKNSPEIFGQTASPSNIVEQMEKIISSDSTLSRNCII